MSADNSMPKGITRDYATAFRNTMADIIARAAVKVLTIPELQALDDADLGREIARTELQNRIKSEDEAA